MGLQTAQGLVCTESFYWDLNDKTRAWTERMLRRVPTNYPNMIHAGCYSGTLHFLKTVAAMGLPAAKASGLDLVNRMKAQPSDDDLFGKATIRPDGRRLIPSYLFEVKTPAESTKPWDYYSFCKPLRPKKPSARSVKAAALWFVRDLIKQEGKRHDNKKA